MEDSFSLLRGSDLQTMLDGPPTPRGSVGTPAYRWGLPPITAGAPTLWEAAAHGDVARLGELLSGLSRTTSLTHMDTDESPIDLRGGRDDLPALSYACAYAQLECVHFLLTRGASVNCSGCDRSPLHCCAVLGDHHECASLLLDHGADLSACNREGENAAAYARRQRRPRVVRVLEEATRIQRERVEATAALRHAMATSRFRAAPDPARLREAISHARRCGVDDESLQAAEVRLAAASHRHAARRGSRAPRGGPGSSGACKGQVELGELSSHAGMRGGGGGGVGGVGGIGGDDAAAESAPPTGADDADAAEAWEAQMNAAQVARREMKARFAAERARELAEQKCRGLEARLTQLTPRGGERSPSQRTPR